MVLESISHHSWYHDHSLVVLSLCEAEEWEAVAKALAVRLQPEVQARDRPAARGFLDPDIKVEF